MLVAEYTADGKTKKWREQQNNLKYAAFQVATLLLPLLPVARGT